MIIIEFASIFLGAGAVGYLLKLKKTEDWIIFLLLWFILYRLTGIQKKIKKCIASNASKIENL
jgi:hypothetical protein